MTQFLTLLISGAASGAIYAIMASGIVLTYQTSGIFNFAHGAVAFTAAYLYFQLHTGQHWPIVPAAVVSILVFAPLLGLALDRIMLRRLASAPVHTRIVGTIGLLVALPNLALWLVEQIDARGGHLPTPTFVLSAPGLGPVPPRQWHLSSGLVLDSDQLAIFAAALLAAVGLWVVLRRTRVGLLMRADVNRRELAALRGIDGGLVSAMTWTVTMVLAALGGVLLSPLFGMNDLTFTEVVLGSMAAIVFGRLRSLPIAFAGGLLLGVLQNLIVGYRDDFLPGFLLHLSGLGAAVPFVLTLAGLVVLARRTGRVAGTAASEAPPPDRRNHLPAWRRRAPWALVAAAIAGYALLFADSFWASLLAQSLVFSIIFLSFVVVTGIGGMVSLAQATFVTTGAFAAGWLAQHDHLNFVLAAGLATALAAAVGALLAVPVRRLGALELALGTLAIAFIADGVVFQISSIRNSSSGYTINPPAIGPFNFADGPSLVILLLLVFAGLTLVVTNLTRSASGRAVFAARSSEVAARTSGLSPDRAKIAVFGLSAGIAGLGGALYAMTDSPFTNTTTPALVGLIWLAVVVTFGVRRPAGALIAGLTYGLGSAVFGKVTGSVGVLHDMTSSSHFLPILFGMGAINLAKDPDGVLALTSGRIADRRRPRAPAAAAAAAGDRAEPPTDPPALALRDVRASYGEVEVLHGIDLEVRAGSICALLGSNGAGKSTLCAVAAGLLPAGGAVFLDETDVSGWPAHRRARGGLLLAPEARGVFPDLTVEENLSVWLSSPAARNEAYERFPALGERRRLRAGLLSGGEQQLLAVAGALVRPPRVFIADEPTLGLAPMAAAQVCEVLAAFRERGSAVLLVEEKTAHVLELADTVAVMQLGRIVWTGPRADLDLDELSSTYLGVGV